ncbi:NAD-P-binding protein [Marasmius fiardii PR-910]|nr:NAD-P-binding protein [Marasmius fiardii PR-910]
MTALPEIKDDVAFITGAASGIGYTLAKELAARGARVILTDIQESACQKLASELNANAGNTYVVIHSSPSLFVIDDDNDTSVAVAAKVDTTSWDEHVAAFELGKQAFGRVDYFFANAGIAEAMWIPKFESDKFDVETPLLKPNYKTTEIDFIGQLNTAALALQVFQRQHLNRHGFRGKLVMTSSLFGFFHSVAMPMYSSSKSGILAFVRSTSDLYKDKNITVNCVCPNMVSTNIVSPDLLKPFREQDLLTPVEFVVEQYISVLGANQDNGKAIGVFKDQAWDQPQDTYRREENRRAYELIDDIVGKLCGYWA